MNNKLSKNKEPYGFGYGNREDRRKHGRRSGFTLSAKLNKKGGN